MRATNTFRALCLGATLGLTGCVGVVHDRPVYGGYEPYDGGGYDGDSYDRYEVHHVYDAPIGVYVLPAYPNYYYTGGWYYRHVGNYWERCDRPRGGHWSRIDDHYVPHRLYARYHGGGNQRGWDRDDHRDWKRAQREERKEDRWERKEDRRDDRDQHRDWKRAQQEQRKEDRWERKEDRRDDRDQHRDWKRAQHEERKDDRAQRAEQQHQERFERKQDKRERAEQRRDDKQERRDQRRQEREDRRDERLAERSR